MQVKVINPEDNKLASTLEEIFSHIEKIEGSQGKTPVKGVDYIDGIDGVTPIKGKDYFDGANGRNPLTSSKIAPLNPQIGDLWYQID